MSVSRRHIPGDLDDVDRGPRGNSKAPCKWRSAHHDVAVSRRMLRGPQVPGGPSTSCTSLAPSHKTLRFCADDLSSCILRITPAERDPNLVNAHAACSYWFNANPLPELHAHHPTYRLLDLRIEHTRRTNELCEDLRSSSLRRTSPEDGADLGLIKAHAVCVQWRKRLKSKRTATPNSVPLADPNAVGIDAMAAPVQPPTRGRWTRIPVELLSHILRLRRVAEWLQQSSTGVAAAPAAVPHGVRRAVGVRGGLFGCDVREAGVGELLLVLPAWGRQGVGGRDPLSRFFLAREMGGRALFFEKLAGLRVLKLWWPMCYQRMQLYDAARHVANAECLAMLQAICATLDAGIGSALQFWAPDSGRAYFADCITATSLPRLEYIEFPYPRDLPPRPEDQLISARFMHKLTSLPTSSPAACPTIEDLDLTTCKPITDYTLSLLEEYQPLHCLDISYQKRFTVLAVVSFFRARGSRLRFLGLPCFGAVSFAAPSCQSPDVGGLADRGGSPPCLHTFAPGWLGKYEGSDGARAYLDALGLAYRAFCPFNDAMTNSQKFAAVGLR
ncbi:hypothetical protein BDK51DRAFT_46857 [Blyttiomyces helicus]|uniref:Uncharacterized protein n=1 Tax=Blyttiomyces helicus TaxID=388810 RepID=A0A4P9WS77_9FUNG|nr:hypothetical protein BDK51DRAFT_46857 [Blyttiomyces helicus]|eukprot:RKO94150.1 hypothetical protein BDK51DRAFT_46857 [Blyttiomyces helicus]